MSLGICIFNKIHLTTIDWALMCPQALDAAVKRADSVPDLSLPAVCGSHHIFLCPACSNHKYRLSFSEAADGHWLWQFSSVFLSHGEWSLRVILLLITEAEGMTKNIGCMLDSQNKNKQIRKLKVLKTILINFSSDLVLSVQYKLKHLE